MPRGEESRNPWSVLGFEALGTLLLVYFAITSHQEATAVSLALFVSYLLFAPISRGHFNPAVSLGVWLGELAEPDVDENNKPREKNWGREIMDFALRIIAQFIGGILGALLAYVVLARHRADGTFGVNPIFIVKLCPKDPLQPDFCDAEGNQMVQLLATQAFLGFIFCLAFILVPKKGVRPSEDKIIQAFAIALIFLGLTHVCELSGASFNPVLSGSLIFFEKFASKESLENSTKYMLGYLVGPLIGAILSSAFFCCVACAGIDTYDTDADEEDPKDNAVQRQIIQQNEENRKGDKSDDDAKDSLITMSKTKGQGEQAQHQQDGADGVTQ